MNELSLSFRVDQDAVTSLMGDGGETIGATFNIGDGLIARTVGTDGARGMASEFMILMVNLPVDVTAAVIAHLIVEKWLSKTKSEVKLDDGVKIDPANIEVSIQKIEVKINKKRRKLAK